MGEDGGRAMSLGAVAAAEGRLRTLLPAVYVDRAEEVRPVSMGSAALAFAEDGRVAWDRMWGSFCDLAMAGGPPHKGKLLEAPGTAAVAPEPGRYAEVCGEIARGIGLTTGLKAGPAGTPGWLRVRCENDTMAGWLVRAITMENVAVRLEGSDVLVPAGPGFRLQKEIKNVITAVTKTAHYWSGHLPRGQQVAIAVLFDELDSEAPLLEPAWPAGVGEAGARARVEQALVEATGLRVVGRGDAEEPAAAERAANGPAADGVVDPHAGNQHAAETRYASWVGLECGSVRAAVTTMRRLVASNVLCRREETAIFVPLNSRLDSAGERVASAVAELLARDA